MVEVRITIGTDRRATADENRKRVDPGERVIWNFVGATTGLELQVRFHSGPPSAPINPFVSLVPVLGVVSASSGMT